MPEKQPFEDVGRRFDNFANSIKKTNKVAVLYDKDGDGITAATLVNKGLKLMRGRGTDYAEYVTNRDKALAKPFLDTLAKKKIDTLFVVDIAVDQHPDLLFAAAKKLNIIVFDHHKAYDIPKHENVVIIKPGFFQDEVIPSQYCTAKLVYDFFYRLRDMSNFDWIAAVGIISDSTYPTWKSFVHRTFKKYNLAVPQTKQHIKIFDTIFGKIGSYLYYAACIKTEYAKKAYNIMQKAENFREALQELKVFSVAQEEIEEIVKAHKQKGEFIGDTVFYECSPKYDVNSAIANKLSHEFYPKRSVFVLVDRGNGRIHISARRQDGKVPMNEILERIAKKLPDAAGGGHIPAAGGEIRKQDIEKFKKLVLEVAEQLRE